MVIAAAFGNRLRKALQNFGVARKSWTTSHVGHGEEPQWEILTDMLEDVIARRPARSIDEVVDLLNDIDAALPATDGLKWFNHLYLSVTEAVRTAVVGGTWNDAPWLTQLDVVFANLYFDALAAGSMDPDAAPAAWTPVLAARQDQGLKKIQFALAGMNAHINRDLPVAVIQTYLANSPGPDRAGARYADYERVNAILETVEGQVKQQFMTGILGFVDAVNGPVDDVLAMWSIRAARDAAWTHAELLWHLRHLPPLQRDFIRTLDGFAGFAGRGLLTHAG